MSENIEWGVYVHIPFCHSKCFYCDFYSRVDNRMRSDYVKALEKEIRTRSEEISGKIGTLYIGGGTPSLLTAEEFESLSGTLMTLVGAKNDESDKLSEFTIEVNPEDVTDDKAVVWKSCGVDRVSMGVQSFNDIELKKIGRRHTGDGAEESYRILRKHFDNVSLDLIFGLPGQTLESLNQTLDRIIGLAPEHISVYSLMFEERTALTKMRDKGNIEEADDNDSVEMFRLVNARLGEAGYERYEISNYSLKGFRSRHNSSYWEGKPYIGFGASAHGYDGDRRRRWNIADIRKYSELINGGGNLSSLFEEEHLSDEELMEEAVMTRLRRREGIDLKEYGAQFGEENAVRLLENADFFIKKGEIEKDGYRIRLTDKGVMVSDEIIVGLIM